MRSKYYYKDLFALQLVIYTQILEKERKVPHLNSGVKFWEEGAC